VAIVDQSTDGSQRVAEEVVQSGGNAKAYPADLSLVGEIPSLVEAVIQEFGRIDILVNSAGITGGRLGILEVPPDIVDQVLTVNVKAIFALMQSVAKHMVARGGGGRIVSLSSSAAFRATSSPAAYAASKAAVNGLTRAAAADLGIYDINVNAVAPGVTKTPMTAAIGDDEAYRLSVSEGPLANLLKRPSEASDVAAVILFLCLPASRQMTGQILHTSAGLVL
jgi:NAD(P)-dependent dehydrogenase (short-subunit alcohol dehydrogenase family)